jgi:ABC-2 type transport system ATP-binding protein
VGDIVIVEDLVKRFGEFTAVDGVSFSIADGEVFGLLGPNGAGKTTTISMICTLLAPTSGDVRVDGASVLSDPAGVKRALGVVPQEIALYPTLTALENLRFWGRMYGLTGRLLDERVAEVLEIAGLADRAKERVETYSGGMKRRINIAAGIMHRPRVLLMDEPTVGIDPQSRNHILETVKGLNERGMTLVYTSHYMEEVEFLCDRVGIIDHGEVIALGTVDELKRLVGDENVISVSVGEAPEGALEAVQALSAVHGATYDKDSGVLKALAPDAGVALASVVEAVSRAGAHIGSIEIAEPNLESVFLHLTGKSLRD